MGRPEHLARFCALIYANRFKLANLTRSGHQFTLSLQGPNSHSSHPKTDLIDALNDTGLIEDATVDKENHNLRLNLNGPLFASHLLGSFQNQSTLRQFACNLLCQDERKKNILIDYSSPNIAKPFHYGHFKSTLLGQFIANLHHQLGQKVTRINYLGDCGTQFGLLSLGYSHFGDEEKLKKDPISHLLEVYIKSNKEQEANANWLLQAKERARKLEENADVSIIEEWKKFVQISIEELQKTYFRLGVNFDFIHRESMYIKSTKKLIEQLDTAKMLQISENGAKVVTVQRPNGEMRSIPIEKADGTSLYLARDVCAAVDRKEKFNFDTAIYVVDQGQSLHFEDVKSLLKALGYSWYEDITHVPFGRISGMSTRKGEAVLFSDILDEAKSLARQRVIKSKNTKVSLDEFDQVSEVLGISALVTNDFRRSRGQNYDFNWKKIMKQDGQTGIALQYCHARLHSLERNCLDVDDFGSFLTEVSSDASILSDALTSDESMQLLLQLMSYGQCLLHCHASACPKELTNFLFNLAHGVNGALRVLKVKNETVKQVALGHLLLFISARQVLADGMRMMGLKPLQVM